MFPVPLNQNYNRNLKDVAVKCGIKKLLYSHLARHTFATTVTLANGVPMETLSRLLTHSKIQTTQIYGKIADQKLSEDMDKLRQKLG